MACVSSHTSDFELRFAEPFPNGKIVKKKYPQRLRELGNGSMIHSLNSDVWDETYAIVTTMTGFYPSK